jgi:hypothetical protein
MVDEKIKKILADGGIRIRVQRVGMLQFQIFTVKKVGIGKDYFVELFLNKIIDRSEIQRLANEIGLPVECENGRAMPEGKGMHDFLNL